MPWYEGQRIVKSGVWIEHCEIRIEEAAVLADELIIKVDFATAILGTLDTNEIPMDLGSIAIIAIIVGVARRKVE